MKTLSQNIKKISVVTGLFLGAFVLSALAGSWTQATCNAPECNTGAPINVTISPQSKLGPLAVSKASLPTTGYALDVQGSGLFSGLLISGRTITDTITIGGVDMSRRGYVLTNDGTGNTEWKAPSSLAMPLSVSAVDSYEVRVLRNTTQKITTPTPYLFCAITKMVNFANSDKDYSNCMVTRLSDGKWELEGRRDDDPDFTCGMTCFK